MINTYPYTHQEFKTSTSPPRTKDEQDKVAKVHRGKKCATYLLVTCVKVACVGVSSLSRESVVVVRESTKTKNPAAEMLFTIG
jgi:hypothetical protein